MILADKILTLRKNGGLSQEELAEKLNVSRQSVSKWESAASIPDIGKIIDIANLFGVTTDYLLKDDQNEITYTSGETGGARRVDVAEANAFLMDNRSYGKKIALGVSLCILSPVLLITLPVLLGEGARPAPTGAALERAEALGAGIGMIALFLLVACAVTLFIVSSARVKRYKYIERGEFELAYGVEGILLEKRAALMPRYTAFIAAGVALCIASPIPLIVAGLADAGDAALVLFTGLLLCIVSAAVYMFISVSVDKESYDQLLREEDYTAEQVEANRRAGQLGGIYWPVVTAAYLAWSFLSGRWDMTWLVWPVAGVLFGAVSAVVKLTGKPKE